VGNTATCLNISNNVLTGLLTNANGYFFIVPFTQLTSPDSSSVPFNVYVRCSNLQVNGMTTQNMPVKRSIFAESGDVSESSNSKNCIASTPVTCFTLNESNAVTRGICLDYFGEQPVSFRALLKRFISTQALLFPAITLAAPEYTRVTYQILPPNNFIYSNSTPVIQNQDLFSYLRYAYLGIKGSIRIRLRVSSLSGAQWVNVGLATPSSTFVNNVVSTASIAAGLYTNPVTAEGQTTFILATNAGTGVELPYYSSNLFQICFNDNYEASDLGNDNMSYTWFRNGQSTFDISANVTLGSVDVLRATGEDFSLLRYQGAPFFSMT